MNDSDCLERSYTWVSFIDENEKAVGNTAQKQLSCRLIEMVTEFIKEITEKIAFLSTMS